MGGALLVARLVLALVFGLAGVTKLADLAGSRQTVRSFGVPAPLASPIGLLLPLAELAVAVLLIPTRTAWGASIGAVVLLGAFIAGVGVNLARGNRPDCHCFGQLYSEPIGVSTLIRNLALVAVAAFVAVAGHSNAGTSTVDWLTGLSRAEVAALAIALFALLLVVTQWWFLVNVLRMNGRLLERIEALEAGIPLESRKDEVERYGLPVGSPAPDFSLAGIDGERTSLADLRAKEKPAMLLFTSPSCGPCSALMPDIASWQRERDDLTVVLISAGTLEEIRSSAAAHGIDTVLVQEANEVAGAYGSPGTPSAVIVEADGTIASPLVAGSSAVRNLADGKYGGIAGRSPGQTVPLLDHLPEPEREGLSIGEPAPAIELPDVGGRQVRLEDFRGSDVMVLFWDTGCGFCRSMLPDLKRWEERRPQTAPEILVVSGGSEAEVKAMGLGSTVVLDPKFNTGQSYGVLGTPVADMVCADGTIASEPAIGKDAVMRLAAGGEALATG